MKIQAIFPTILGLVISTPLLADEQLSLSTSNLVQISHIDSNGADIPPCSGKRAIYANSYVSLSLKKFTVNKDDSLVKRIFNKNRSAFATATLNGNYNGIPLSISKVGSAYSVKGKESSIDLGVEWSLIDRTPWVLKNSKLNIKIGYTAESTIESLANAFSSITSSIPDYTVSTSLQTGIAITSSVDSLLFGPDRALYLLNAERDIPLQVADGLCDGFYAVFAAQNKEIYEKYFNSSVIWNGDDLLYDGNPIKDATYAVIQVSVSDRYYKEAKHSIDDLQRQWAQPYRDVSLSLFNLTWIFDAGQLDKETLAIREKLLKARTLLNADVNLIQDEKNEIHGHMLAEVHQAIDGVKKRIASNGTVTKASTIDALYAFTNSEPSTIRDSYIEEASEIIGLLENDDSAPIISNKQSKELGDTLQRTIYQLEFVAPRGGAL